MKLGLLADIHGNTTALAAALDALQGNVDGFLFLGDLAGYYPFVNECASLWPLQMLGAVRGNHDQVLLECSTRGEAPSTEYVQRYGSALTRTLTSMSPAVSQLIASWPLTQTCKLEGNIVQLVHGAPWDALGERVYPDFEDWGHFAPVAADVILLGHTHYPLRKEYAGKLIVNPGSVGQARDQSGAACCAVLDLPSRDVTFVRVPYSPESVIDDARQHDPHLPYVVEVLRR